MGFVNLINQPNWAVTLKMHLFGFVSSCCDTYFLITVAADSSYQLLLSKRVLKATAAAAKFDTINSLAASGRLEPRRAARPFFTFQFW